jgi:hypothetical protein
VVRPTGGRSNTQIVNADYSFGDTTTGIVMSADSMSKAIMTSLNTTGYSYYFIINRDGIFIGVKVGATDQMMYAGLFEPLFSYVPFGVPLCIAARSSANQGYMAAGNTASAMAATTRHPNMAVGSNANQAFQHSASPYLNTSFIAGDYQTVDRFTGKAEGKRVLLTPTGNNAGVTGMMHGLLKHCFFLGGPSSGRLGDTLTFDSRVHIAAGTFVGNPPGTSMIWIDTEAA